MSYPWCRERYWSHGEVLRIMDKCSENVGLTARPGTWSQSHARGAEWRQSWLWQSQRPKEGKDGIAKWGQSDGWQEFGRRGKNPQVEAPSRKNFRANPNIEAGCWSNDGHCRCQQRLARSTSSKVNVNSSSVSAGDNFEIVGQNDNCVQRREWGSLRLDRALTMYQSPLRISLRGLTCHLWACQLSSIQLKPLHLDASVPWPGRLKPRDSFSEATLSLSHTSSQCLLFWDLTESGQMEKTVKINILPRDVKLSCSHLMGSGSRMPQSIGAHVTYSM